MTLIKIFHDFAMELAKEGFDEPSKIVVDDHLFFRLKQEVIFEAAHMRDIQREKDKPIILNFGRHPIEVWERGTDVERVLGL